MKRKLLFVLAIAFMGSMFVSEGKAQGVISINHKTKRYIGDVSTFDRNKYTNAHILFSNTDNDFEIFKTNYNINQDYIGGRQFWNPFGLVNNGVIPNINKVFSGVREVSPYLVGTGSQGKLFYDNTVDYSTEDVSAFSQQAAQFIAQNYRDQWDLVPAYIEPFNEPMVHANEFYPEGRNGQYIGSKTEAVITKICEFHRDLGQAIHAVPELANMKVMGFASAYPEFENNDFDLWTTRYQQFIDVAGADVDVFSLHLYDGSGINNSGGRRSGSNSEAILDIIETYSFKKFNKVKPLAITEFGRLVPNQTGWAAGNGVSNYEPVENSQAVRSQIHLVMNFMEREDHMELVIPFNVNTRNKNSQYSKSSIWVNNASGQPELTQRIYYYEMLKDIKGDRVRINSSNVDVQAQAFVNENQLIVLLNNLNDNAQTVNLNVFDTQGLQSVDIKRLKIFLDKTPELTNTTETSAPANITLQYGETVVLKYNFDAPISFENTIYSKKHYSADYLKTITANAANSFSINDVVTGYGNAILRVSIAREHGKSLNPTITINGHKVSINGDIIRGYDQNSRKQFFGTLEIPVPMDILIDGTNTIDVEFNDNGGRISSVVLQVEKADNPVESLDSGIFSSIKRKNLQLIPNHVKAGEVVNINVPTPDIEISICNIQGKLMYKGSESSINTSFLEQGLYIVTAKSADALYSAKLIVN